MLKLLSTGQKPKHWKSAKTDSNPEAKRTKQNPNQTKPNLTDT